MDLKALLNKLDKLDQRQVLMESATVVEEVLSAELQLLKESYIALMERVRGKELDALRNIDNEEQRKTRIAALATKHGYPGMFDPVTGKWVDNQGNYAWFGPYKAEVEKMEQDGLVPPEAHTSAFWGIMGKDKDAAYQSSLANKSKFELVDTADEIIDKANQSKKTISESISKGSIARAITEGFGYSFNYIVESISEDEHTMLKATIEKLNDTQYKDDKDVQALIYKYQEYVKYRDQLIAKIRQALEELKGKMPKAQTVNESRENLTEEIYLVPHSDNTVSSVHFYLDANGNVVEYVITEDVEALGRGLLNGLTLGWGDNAVAKMISMYKGTDYGEELMKQLKATDAAKERSPVWYWGGNIAGGAVIIPGGGGAVAGLVKGGVALAAQAGSDKYLRDPHNAKYQQQAAQKANQPPAQPDNKAVKKVQNTVSAPVSGQMDAPTVTAIRQNAAPVTAPSGNEGMSDAFQAFGVKDMNELQAKLKKLGVDSYEKLGQAVGNALKITPAPTATSESIIYSSMTDAERMTYLRNRLTQLEETRLDEAGISWSAAMQGLEKLTGGLIKSAESKALASLEKLFGGPTAKVFLTTGERFEPQLGSPGKWIDASGKRAGSLSSEEVLQLAQAEVQAGKIIPATTNRATGTAIPAKPNLPKPTAVVDDAVETLNGVKYQKNQGAWKAVKGTNKHGQPIFDKNPVDAKTAKTLEKNAQAKAQAKTQPSTNNTNTNTPPASTTAPKPTPNKPATSTNTPPTSAATAVTMTEKLAAQFPKTAAVLKGLGSVARFGWSKKWWLIVGGIIAAGYLVKNNNDENKPDDENPTNNVVTPVDGKCPAGYKLSADGKTCEKVESNQQVVPQGPTVNGVVVTPEQLKILQQSAGNIKTMLKQLVDMYPADKETKDLKAEVDDVLKGIPEPVQSSQKVQTQPAASATGVTNAFGYEPPKGGYAGTNNPRSTQ